MHGAALVQALKGRFPTASYRGMGGQEMAAAGMELVRTYHSVNVMGFWEVLKRLRHIRQVMRFLKAQILDFRPDALILIDFPGFNMRMAKWAHRQGIPVVYYILPQVWAWRSGRARKMGRWVDLPLAILPFEPPFYARYGVDVHYVGHPLVERIRRWQAAHPVPAEKSHLVLMPGSRPQEIHHILPRVLEGTRPWHDRMPTVVVKSAALAVDFYRPLLQPYPAVQLFEGHPYEALAQARAAVVASGTATLETALWKVPQVVVYRGGALSYAIARRVVKVPFISLVNLIAEEKVVEELIQQHLTPSNVSAALQGILQGPEAERMAAGYYTVKQRLSSRNASEVAAEKIAGWVGERHG